MIKKITITAVALRKTKKDGTPYTFKSKKDGGVYPRTLVSIKDDQDNWYMGWSYKDGSAAETVQKGQTLELFITEDGEFKNWRFVKDDDKKDAELAELKAKLAALEAPGMPEDITVGVNKENISNKKQDEPNVNNIPF